MDVFFIELEKKYTYIVGRTTMRSSKALEDAIIEIFINQRRLLLGKAW